MSPARNRASSSTRTRSVTLGLIWIVLALAIAGTQFLGQASIDVKWKTASEYNTAGFNIYRSLSTDQGFQKINSVLIDVEGDTTVGAEYTFIDRDVVRGETYYYRLEDVELNGSTTLHEIVTGQAASYDNWILALAALCLVIGLVFIFHALRSKPTAEDLRAPEKQAG